MTETVTAPAPVWRPSPEFIRTSLLYLALGIAMIGAAALALSFMSVANAARPYFGDASWVIPVVADVTIAILFFLSISMELNGLRSPLASYGAKALVGFTVYANVAPQHGLYGKILHGAPPIVWTLTVVIAEGAIRKLVGLSDEKRVEQVRRSLWLLRPVATWRIWRRMRIEQIPSYREALDRDAARAAVVGRLRLNHGRMWRNKAPLAERIALRLEGRDPAGVAKTLKAHGAVVTLLADTAAPKTGSEQRKAQRNTGRKSTADAIAALRAKQPELTQVTVANRLKLTDRTVRKYWADTTPAARPAVHAVPDATAA
jgi:DNA-binding transcriptional regulator YiaG